MAWTLLKYLYIYFQDESNKTNNKSNHGECGDILLEVGMKTLVAMVVLAATSLVSSEAFAARCSVELKAGNGRVLEVFQARGYSNQDACQEAKRDCRQVLRAGYYRAKRQSCEVVRQQRTVERSCSVEMTAARGHRVLDYMSAKATGLRGTGVLAKACTKAINKCVRRAQNYGRTSVVCRAENGTYQRVTNRSQRPSPRPTRPRRGRY